MVVLQFDPNARRRRQPTPISPGCKKALERILDKTLLRKRKNAEAKFESLQPRAQPPGDSAA
ncbi:MAG: hypothetical protein PWQ57_1078 [Desulfovibrionales bacterium]|jgi:hypothetical protein|nr:hypothetical protein [Desulfovibrionales bacterium]